MASTFLVDTNVLLRLFKEDQGQYPRARSAVNQLAKEGINLAYTLQNLTEFWNVSTRAKERNGLGLNINETELNVREIEIHFAFVPDNEAVYREWRRLVFLHSVSGVQVHDARLAAAMYAHGISHILTFNGNDFARYPGLTAIHPTSVGK